MTSSAENTVESRNKLHSAILAAAYLNKHSHALEESILRRTIVQVSEVSEPLTYCASCDALTVDRCLQLLTQLNSLELQIVVKKTAEILTDDGTKVAMESTAKTGFKPSSNYQRRSITTNFSYAKMKGVVKGAMLQQKTVERTLREAAFFNPKGNSKVGPTKRSPRKKRQKNPSGDQSGCNVANIAYQNQDVPTTQESPIKSNVPVPRVKLDADGQIVVDPQSLVAQPPLAQNRISKPSTSNNFKWPFADTVKFYEALYQHGTDFSLMVSMFTNRMRSNLKRKFKSEDKKNGHLVDMVMKHGSTPSDLQEVIRQLKIQNDIKSITRVTKF